MNVGELKQEIEKKILKYLFSNIHYLALADSVLKKEYFDHYKNVYRMMMVYYHRSNGIITNEIVKVYLSTNKIDSEDYTVYQSLLNELDDIKINNDESEFRSFVDSLIEEYKKMEYMQLATKIVDMDPLHNNLKNLKELEIYVTKKVTEITTDNSVVRASGSLRESVKEQIERYTELKNNPNTIQYIPTGFPKIDDAEGGFRYSELVYIIGRKGAGKSVLMLNLAHNAWVAGKNVLLFSLEISKEDYERRLAACACNIRSNGLKRGTLAPDEEGRFKIYLKNLAKGLSIEGEPTGEMVIVDVPAQCKPSFIEATLLAEQRKRNIKFDVVIVDYAGIMQPDIAVPEKRHQQGQIALDFKNMARKYNCVFISAAQMSRQGRNDTNQKGGHADTAHIAESDQVADHIDWGIAVRVENQDSKYGILESFKTRDAEPFSFSFLRAYDKMRMEPIASGVDDPAGLNWGTELQ